MAIELINYFQGEWSFTREIKIGEDKLFAIAKGNASFTKEANVDSLFYSEDGELDLKHSKTKNLFYKNYLFSFFANHIKVYFSGGANSEKVYQEYKYTGNKIVPIAGHACNRDFYNTEYVIIDQNHFEQGTKISGPQKDYQIMTVFNRISAR
jgi:hypothetical protein